MKVIDKIAEAKRVFDIEIEALNKMRDALDGTFITILDLVTGCKGKVIITGIGKPGHIGTKLAATLSSLGTPSFFLHPAEAMHGDLGMVSEKDVVIAISYSGESDEIVKILPNIKMSGAVLIGITRNRESTLAMAADIVQCLPSFREACHLGLAPTASTTTVLCYGDALAVAASTIYGFTDADFGKYHPAGALGKKLIFRVSDLMARGDDVPMVFDDTLLMDAITVMTKKGMGMVVIVNTDKNVLGLITDGDLRRMVEKRVDIYSVEVKSVMIKKPKIVNLNMMAVDALKYIKMNSINCLPVVDENEMLVGTITWQMIVKAGIVV